MIDKLESVNWPNVWWILGGDYLTFEGVMGDFRKNVLQTDFERKKSMQINSWEKNILHRKKMSLNTYNAEKNLTSLYVGEKIS